jgi:hypothetical protein
MVDWLGGRIGFAGLDLTGLGSNTIDMSVIFSMATAVALLLFAAIAGLTTYYVRIIREC